MSQFSHITLEDESTEESLLIRKLLDTDLTKLEEISNTGV